MIGEGATEVQVSVVEMDLEKEKALNIALNKISGDWDDEKLAALLQELSDSPIGIELTGFEQEELDDLLSQLPVNTEIDDPIEEDGFDVEKAIENIIEPETNYGDVWKLGCHLLVCGDATILDDIQKLMVDDKADLVITDLPYNCYY